jgi:hypothetical protein
MQLCAYFMVRVSCMLCMRVKRFAYGGAVAEKQFGSKERPIQKKAYSSLMILIPERQAIYTQP